MGQRHPNVMKMKALVLAGGKGTRLRPFTYTIAKQLIPVANKPILWYVIRHILDAGIREMAVIISPETGNQVQEAISSFFPGLDINYVLQPQPLGLGHAVKEARPFLEDSPFVMYLGDNLIGSGIQSCVKTFQDCRPDALLTLKNVQNPRPFGVAVVDGKGKVLRVIEKPKEPPSNLALVGIYVFSAAIHEAIEEIKPSWRGELEITDAIQWLLDREHNVQSFILQGWWLDTGKKDDLLEANRLVLDDWGRRDIQGTVDTASKVVGRVALEKHARVYQSEVRGPVAIDSGTVIERAFVGPYSSIGRGCSIKNSALEHCVVMDNVTVQDAGRLEDSILGRNTVVRRRASDSYQALKLMVGDDAEVLL